MQSRRSGSEGPFLNPTILAMIGSVGAHGILALISALHPAEGKPSSLQVLSIAPQGNSPKIKGPGTVSVPNGLPPINLGKVPQLPAAPDMSVAKIQPSQSLYVGSPSNLGKLPVSNIPTRSFPDYSMPNAGQMTVPNSIFGGVTPPIPKGTPGNFGTGALPSSRSGYEALPPPQMPKLSGGQAPSNGNNLSSPNSSLGVGNLGLGNLGTGPGDTISDQARRQYKDAVNLQSQRYGQRISAQSGPWLRADYPPEACTSRQNGYAVVSGLYGPDGSIVSSDDSVKVLESAGNPAFDQAAIAEVQRQRVSAAGVYQSFSFKVDIPYSSSVCLAAQPSPSASPTVKPGSTTSPSPSSSTNPSPSSQPINMPSSEPANVPSSTGQPGQPLAPPKAIPIDPNDIPAEPQTPPKQPAPVQSAVPEPAPAESPAPNAPAAPSLEPLPQSSIAPTETPQPKP